MTQLGHGLAVPGGYIPYGNNLLAEATTDLSGNWSLTVDRSLAGRIFVWDPDGDYGFYYSHKYDGSDWRDSVTMVRLEEGGRLSGTITGNGTPAPEGDYSLYGRSPWIFRTGNNRWVPTGATRHLVCRTEATTSVTQATFPNPMYLGPDPIWEQSLMVRTPQPTMNCSSTRLSQGASPTGSGNGLSGIRVYASPTGGSAESFLVTSPVGGSSKRFETLTDHDGNYSYDSAVPGSSFTVEFRSLSGKYATEYYDDKTSLDEADAVEIPRRGDVPNIDAQLGPGSTVSGSVIEITEEDPTGAPRWSAAVYLCSNDHCQRTRSNSAGFFKLSGLSPATYSLRVSIWRSEAETTVELSEGTERYFVAVLDGDNSEITEHQDDASDTFEDIADGAHHEQAVAWMIRHGITTGCNREPALFCPDSDLTRAQFVTFLWRASGKPEPSIAGSEVFGDVAAGHFADQAIGWAKEADVTTGCAQATETTEARFCIDSPVKRGQIATFLHRFVEEPESTLDHGFTDIDQGRYFSEPVAWTAEHMFVDGCSSTSFCPDDDADRATAAVFIHGVATNPDSWANRTSDFQYG